MGLFDNYSPTRAAAGPTGLQQQEQQNPQQVTPAPSGQPGGMFDAYSVNQSKQPNVMTGGQVGSTQNGWNTPFYQQAFAQRDEEAKSGQAQNAASRKDYTGIVSWDDQQDSSGRKAQFGDLYNGGKYQGNIYQAYDKHTADQMMAQLTLDNKTQQQVYQQQQSDPNAISNAVQKMRQQSTQRNQAFLSQQEYNQKVGAQEKSWAPGGDHSQENNLVVAGGALGGAAVGAGIGSIIPGVGTAIGAVVGGIVGGIGGGAAAYANRDEIVQQAAQVQVQTDMARKNFGEPAAIATGVMGWSGVAGKAFQPLTNAVHGITDATIGTNGDGKADWYKMDAKGNNVRPMWATALSVGAGLADSVGQFATGLGAGAYMAQMAGQIGGEVGQLAATGGSSFSDARGKFKNIFTDDQGNFDPISAAAGIANVGIDVAQMAIPAGLGKVFGGRAALKDAFENGAAPAKRMTEGGFSYKVGADGKAIDGSRRLSYSILAPSEQLTAISTRVYAKRAAAERENLTAGARYGVKPTADDYFQAARNLSEGDGRWVGALVTAVGEGYEEAAQQILQPMSTNDQVDWQGVLDAGVQGAALGAGIHLGTAARGAAQPSLRNPLGIGSSKELTADDRNYMRAVTVLRQSTGTTQSDPEQILPRATFDKMPSAQQKAFGMLSTTQQKLSSDALDKIRADQDATYDGGVYAVEAVRDAARAQVDGAAAKRGTTPAGAFVITGAEDATVPGNAVQSSLHQLVSNVTTAAAAANEKVAAAQTSDPESVARLTLEAQQTASLATMLKQVDDQVTAVRASSATPAEKRQAIEPLLTRTNQLIQDWHHNGAPQLPTDSAGSPATPDVIAARKRAASQLFVRNPQDQPGSYPMLMPQANLRLTLDDSDNVLVVGFGILKAMGGDFDGDKIVQQSHLDLDDNTFANLRSGRNLAGNIGDTGLEFNVDSFKHETDLIDMLAGARRSNNQATRAAEAMARRGIREGVRARYTGHIDEVTLQKVVHNLVENLRVGKPDTKQRLLQDLATLGGDAFWKRGLDNLSNEPLFIDQLLNSHLQSFRKRYSIQVGGFDMATGAEIVTPTRKNTIARDVRQQMAATEGQTLGQKANGWSLFRQFQKLHYSVRTAKVSGGERRNIPGALDQLAQLYEDLGQNLTSTMLEQAASRDAISQDVLAQLRMLTEATDGTPTNEMALVALSSVPQLDENGYPTGKPIAWVQALLSRAIARDQARNATHVTDELRTKWARLSGLTRPGNESEAFLEVFSAVPLWRIAPAGADALGPELTVGQFARLYGTQSETDRRTTSQAMRAEPGYGTAPRHDGPYDFQRVADGEISSYRAVAEALIKAGNSRIGVEDDGTPIGDFARRSNSISESFHRAISNIEQTFREYSTGIELRSLESASDIRTVLDRYPDAARAVFALIPDASKNAVFDERDGIVYVSNWVFDMLAMQPAEAEMHYWRNLKLAQWHAFAERFDGKRDDRSAYDQLDSRIHRLMYRLSVREDGGLSLLDFIQHMEVATSTDEFIKYVNTSLRARNEAPFTAWMDDANDFEPDLANGGWSSSSTDSDIREAIGTLKDRSEALLTEVRAEVLADEVDADVLSALAAAAADPKTASADELDQLDQWHKLVEMAKVMNTSVSPNVMRHQWFGALSTFSGQRHTKGIASQDVVAVGASQILGDAPSFATPFERIFDSLVSVDAEDLGSNPQVLAHRAVDSMDEHGRVIKWDGSDADKLLQVYATNKAARSLIRSMVFPSTYDSVDGRHITQKFLTGKSMTELLRGDVYNGLYGQNPSDKLNYLSAIEGLAKNFGGSEVVQRFLNDVLIAHTSSVKAPMTTLDKEQAIDRRALEAADIIRLVGDVAARGQGQSLTAVKAKLTDYLKSVYTGRGFRAFKGLESEERTALLSSLENSMMRNSLEEIKALNAAGDAKGLAAAEAALKQQRERLDAFLDSDEFSRYRNSVEIDFDTMPAELIGAKKLSMMQLVRDHGTSLKTKAPWASEAVDQLLSESTPLDADGVPVLAFNEETDQGLWTQLSDALTAVYVEDSTSTQALGMAVPELKWDKVAIRRYYDPSWSYLLDEILDPASPLVQAAAQLHTLQHGSAQSIFDTEDDLERKIRSSLLHPERLGEWTADIPRASIEAQQSLDAAASGDGVAAAGISPRKQLALSEATRYQYTAPAENTVSTGVFNWADLNGGEVSFKTQLNLVDGITVPDVDTPFVMLNGRMANGASITVAGGDPIDIWPGLGMDILGHEDVIASGFRAITVAQLKRAVDAAIPAGADKSTVSIQLNYLHPDSQPHTSEHFNSIYYEGVVGEMNTQIQESLVAAGWFGSGGLSTIFQNMALSSRKKGKLAYTMGKLFQPFVMQGLEANARTDFSRMLQSKAMSMLSTDLGNGELNDTLFNFVLKTMKMRHFMRGVNVSNGQPELWPAERVIEWQRHNPGHDIAEALQGAELWKPPHRVLLTMLGDTGDQGVRGAWQSDYDIDPSEIPAYRGVTDELLKRMPAWKESTEIYNTTAASRTFQSRLSVRPVLNDSERAKYSRALSYQQQRRVQGHTDRDQNWSDGRAETFAKQNTADAIAQLRKQVNGNVLRELGLPALPMIEIDSQISQKVLRSIAESVQLSGRETAWKFHHVTESELKPEGADRGVLTQHSLNPDDPAAGPIRDQLLQGDIVIVDAHEFHDLQDGDGVNRVAIDDLQLMANQGATIVLTDSSGRRDDIDQMRRTLRDQLGYKSLATSNDIFVPMQESELSANKSARASSLVETHRDPVSAYVSVLLTDKNTSLPMTENGAILVDGSGNAQVALPTSLVPVNAFGTFGIPQTPERVRMLQQHILSLRYIPNLFAQLVDQSGISDVDSPAADDLREAIDRLIERWDSGDQPEALPRRGEDFGLGDIIPLMDRRGRVLLYRHGMKAPSDVETQLNLTAPDSVNAANVAIYSAEPEDNATVYSGPVIRFEMDSKYGLRVFQRIPLQKLGDKWQLEANGMKYVIAPTDHEYMPEHDVLPGHRITLLSDWESAKSKESTGGVVNNFRNAFAFFGVDFTPEILKVVDGTDYDTLSAADKIAARATVTEYLRSVHRSAQLDPSVIDELLRMPYLHGDLDAMFRATLGTAPAPWLDLAVTKQPETLTPEQQITRAAVLYMMAPTASPDDILSADGFGAGRNALVNHMPQLFTNHFDRSALDSDLRTHLIEKLNANIVKASQASNGFTQGYSLGRDFTFRTQGREHVDRYSGYLQFAPAFSSGDNPVTNGQAHERVSARNYSRHSVDVAWQAINARTAAGKADKHSDTFVQLRSGMHTDDPWAMLNAVADADRSRPSFAQERPAEIAYRRAAYAAAGQARHALEVDEWKDGQQQQYEARRRDVAVHAGLLESESPLVDYWVRGFLYAMKTADSKVRFKHAMQALEEMDWNLSQGYLPSVGGGIPLLHPFDLMAMYRGRKRSGSFTPVDGIGSHTPIGDNFQDWTTVALGSTLVSSDVFDPAALLATDGYMHAYQDGMDPLVGLPISLSSLKAAELVHPSADDIVAEVDRMVNSLNPDVDLLTHDPIILNTAQTNLADLLGAERVGGGYRAKSAPDSILSQRMAERYKWRKENGIPLPVDTTMREFRKNGVNLINESTTTNTLMRIITNLRVGNAMLNPLLWVSAGPEMWARGLMDGATNLLMGQATDSIGGKLNQFLSDEQINQLSSLTKELGQRSDFKGMLYTDMTFHQDKLSNAGRAERWTAAYAKFGASWQDPTYGMSGKMLAGHYMNKVVEQLRYYDVGLSVEQLVAAMRTDPTYLKRKWPDLHEAAEQHIANLRSLRPTPLSLLVRGIYEPMTESPKLGVNLIGHLAKWPLLFTGYTSNVLVQTTGMQGLSQMVAMFAEGRNKGLIGRIQAAIKGVPFDPSTNYIDMSSALDGISLSKMFIQGGITHAGLFAAGLAAGGLGLTGEDDEERRRRRAALVHGGQYIYDPRKVENDVRNADAVFLDWLPPFFSSWFKTGTGDDERSMANMPWIVKQFISPIIGMERFFDTGDPKQILWGFQDAVGSMPLFNASTFDSASSTFAELMAAADDQAKDNSPKSLAQSYGFMVSAVGTLERMLFENSFVNMIYVGSDKYDRDQWKKPLTDADGNIQFDLNGQPRTTTAMNNFIDPTTGEIKTGYVSRDWSDAIVHQLSENRFGMALMLSLGTMVTGGHADFFRDQMVTKQRKIGLQQLDEKQAAGLVLKAYDQAGGEAGVLTANDARAVFNGLYSGSVQLGSPALEGFYVPFEMRNQLQSEMMQSIIQEGVNAGLTAAKAKSRMYEIWYGPSTNPNVVGLKDIIWSKDIPYGSTVSYNQLNTTYITGPDGKPLATGVTRDGLNNLFGLAPSRFYTAGDANLSTDSRLNSTDGVVNLNTGMRALEKIDQSWTIPTDAEIEQSLEKAIQQAMASNNSSSSGKGYTPYSYKKGSYSKGSGYGSSSWVTYGGRVNNLYNMPTIGAPRLEGYNNPTSGSPYLRRSNIRRERFSSDRGRLNQWQ